MTCPGSTWAPGSASDALADLLSLVASVTEEQGSARDLSLDNAILERVIDVLAEIRSARPRWPASPPGCGRWPRSATRATTWPPG